MTRFLTRLSLVCATLSACAATAGAADLTVTVTDAKGKPVVSAVVTFTPNGGATLSAADRAGPFTMAQKNIHFDPFVLAVPVGATVNFPNQDRVNHHVYSFSPVQPFQFPLYGHGQTRSLKFEHEGTVALACNIHDSMSAYVRVVATPYFATTDATGHVSLTGLPETAGTLAVWQPLLDAPEHSVAKPVTLKGSAVQTFTVKIKPAPVAASTAY
ncbi:MAG TPA: hypothetical protein VG839_01665 [Asticcacaulis sp.]|nr:hypothetical protein [Asticcacaulis sp.]